MHICFITHEYPKDGFAHGGVGSFVKTTAKLLLSAGVRVSVVGVNYDSTFEHTNEDGIQIYRVKKHNVRGISWLLNYAAINKCLKQINKTSPIDVVEASELGLAFINKLPGIKYVIRMHGGHHFFAESENRGINFWKGFQEKRSFKKSDGFIAVSEYVGIKTRECLKFEFSFETIYNSVDTNKFNLSPTDKIRQDSLLFLGTICEKKGVRQLVLAMPEILSSSPNAVLTIIGRDWFFPDGRSYITYLKNFIPNDLKDVIKIVGSVPHSEVGDYLDETEICVLPSHMEAMPLAWLEALSKGKAFVGSDIGPGREAVEDKKTGLLANQNDPSDIAEKVNWMLNNKEEAIKMGLEARATILRKFNPQLILKQNLNFYNKILK